MRAICWTTASTEGLKKNLYFFPKRSPSFDFILLLSASLYYDCDFVLFICVCVRHLYHFAGLEFIEQEVAAMMRGVDVDGNERIEWRVRGETTQ